MPSASVKPSEPSLLVAVHEAVGDQLLLDAVQGGQEARIPRAAELDERHDEGAGVQGAAAGELHVGLPLGAPRLFLDVQVGAIGARSPPVQRRRQPALGGDARPPLEGHPGHHAGVGEPLHRAADLPHPVVGLLPVPLEPVELAAQRHPELVGDGLGIPVVEVHRVHQLAVDVQLQLVSGPVADAHRPGVPVAPQVVQALLGGDRAAVEGVEDAQAGPGGRLGAAGLEPVHEGGRLLGEAQPHQRVDGEGRVADPREAVVPVAAAADGLRQ